MKIYCFGKRRELIYRCRFAGVKIRDRGLCFMLSDCRWGILGTSQIAHKNWRAIHEAGNARLVAVASRDAHRARVFIDSCQTQVPFLESPAAVSGYDALLARDDVDAVYLPLPTGTRSQWAIRAAEFGKHVLVEKPCAASVAELEAVIAACDAAGVQFMDGVMFLHSRRLDAVRGLLVDAPGGIGRPRRIAAQFSFLGGEGFLADNIRMRSDLEPLGCLGDLGWYTIAFPLWLLAPRLPRCVTGRIIAAGGAAAGSPAVPTEFAGELVFPGVDGEPEVTASFFCSFLSGHQQWVHISGTRGSMRIDDFVIPYCGPEVSLSVAEPHYLIEGCDFRMEPRDRAVSVREHSHGHPTSQEATMFRAFSRLVLDRRTDRSWPNRSLAVQRVLMACLASAHDGGHEVELNG
jgi:predicted dehydrogenase